MIVKTIAGPSNGKSWWNFHQRFRIKELTGKNTGENVYRNYTNTHSGVPVCVYRK